MNETTYDKIITYLINLLGTISQTNGYRTDAGFHVHKNLEYKTAPKDTPCSILFPGEVTDTLDGDPPPSQGEENHLLPFTLEGWIKDDESGDQGEALRQDFLRALKSDRYFGGLTEGYVGGMTSDSAIVNEGEGFISSVRVDATVLYVTAYGEM